MWQNMEIRECFSSMINNGLINALCYGLELVDFQGYRQISNISRIISHNLNVLAKQTWGIVFNKSRDPHGKVLS